MSYRSAESASTETDFTAAAATASSGNSLSSPPEQPAKFTNDFPDSVVDCTHLATVMGTNRGNLIIYPGQVGRCHAQFLVDGGATPCLISRAFVMKHRLKVRTIDNGPTFKLPDQTLHQCHEILDVAAVRIGPYQECLSPLYVFPGNLSFDVILGKNWLDYKNPDVNWPKNELTFWHNNEVVVLTPALFDSTTQQECIISAVEASRAIEDGAMMYICALKPAPADANLKQTLQHYVKAIDELKKEFADVMPAELPPELPPKRFVDHRIEQIPGVSPVAQAMYRLSYEELAELKKQLTDLLEKGFIQPSKSPYGAPILFVKKKGGALRMCVDYRALNRVTIKNRAPLPRIDDLLERLNGAKYFTCLDLRSGYNQVRIHEEDVPKTAFRTRYGHYEFKVLPFGLCNAPATFQTLMNHVFRDVLDEYVLVYLDDIMIYSKTPEEHLQHIREVLERLRDHKLYLNGDKCKYFQTEVDWLGHIVSDKGAAVDHSKTAALRDWPAPKNVKELQSFLGFTGWYRRFIDKYSHAALPLTDLTKKNGHFFWGPEHQAACDLLKKKLSDAPVLALPRPDFSFLLYTDASDFAIGGVLMQNQGDGPRPVAYFSRKLNDAERKYIVPDKEALALVYGLQQWRHLLQGAPRSTAYTDSSPLRYLQTQPKLNARQARWMLVLQEYDLHVDFVAGKANVVADALSRRPDHMINAVAEVQSQPVRGWFQRIVDGYEQCQVTTEIIEQIKNGTAQHYTLRGPYVVRTKSGHSQLLVPDVGTLRQDLLREHHDVPLAGHFSAAKTTDLLLRHYYWPSVHKDVKQYIKSCTACAVSKGNTQKPAGLLQPLPIPSRRFEVITMDFVTALPETPSGHDAIFIMVDKLTKRLYLAPCTSSVTAVDAAELLFQNVIRYQGVPSTVLSDRGSQFTSAFFRSVCAQLNIQQNLTTAYHPQTDGQSERAVRTVTDALRCFALDYPDWTKVLPAIEFAYNNSVNPSTGFSPFFLCYGENPPSPPAMDLRRLELTNPCQAAVDFAAATQGAIELAQQRLLQAQERQKKYADEHRRPLEFKVGDEVYLSTENLPLAAPRKLAPKWFGPCKILARVGSTAYRLELPPKWKQHPVFHVSRLKPVEFSEKFPRRNAVLSPPSPDLEEGDNIYEVEAVVGRRQSKRGRGYMVEYLIHWAGYPEHERTWERKTTLQTAGTGVQQMLREADAKWPSDEN